jgi:hypothetical protein
MFTCAHDAVACREFGPVFSWMLGPTKMTTVVDYDAIKSLLQLGDSKVGAVTLQQQRQIMQT